MSSLMCVFRMVSYHIANNQSLPNLIVDVHNLQVYLTKCVWSLCPISIINQMILLKLDALAIDTSSVRI